MAARSLFQSVYPILGMRFLRARGQSVVVARHGMPWVGKEALQ